MGDLPSPPYTEATVELVADAVAQATLAPAIGGTRRHARLVLDALFRAGLLLPEGAETRTEAKPSTKDLPAGVRDAAWHAYLAEDTVTAAIDAAVTTTYAAMVNRSSEARDRILARHAGRPDDKCVMCRWADGSVAASPCPDYLDAQALVPADGIAAGRAQAAADIRTEMGLCPVVMPLTPDLAAELVEYCAQLAEGGGEADLSKDHR